MKKITVFLDDHTFEQKPTPQEAAMIRKRLQRREITRGELFVALINGQTVLPAVCDEQKNFLSQQVFLVDVDGGRTLQENMKLCRSYQLYPALAYRTFSGGQFPNRHRMVFVLEEAITDPDKRDAMQEALTRCFGGDPCTKDRSRLFYGAKRPLLQLGMNVSSETAERFLREWSADG